MDSYVSSHFWSRYPDTSNGEAELWWESGIHFHSCIRQSDRVEAEPSLCVLVQITKCGSSSQLLVGVTSCYSRVFSLWCVFFQYLWKYICYL